MSDRPQRPDSDSTDSFGDLPRRSVSDSTDSAAFDSTVEFDGRPLDSDSDAFDLNGAIGDGEGGSGYSSLDLSYEPSEVEPGAFFDSFNPEYEQIAQISLEFEKRWTQDRDFSIEEALERVEEDAAEELFARLLEIDIAKGFESGASFGVEDYERRFPKWTKIVQEVYYELANQSVVVNRRRVGRIIGNFQILSILGKGGMGVVYKAFDCKLKRYVALKYLLPRFNGQEDGVEDFMNEIKLQGQLRGSRFVRAYSVHKDGNYVFLAMEYIDGSDLTRYYNGECAFRGASGPLPFLEAARIIAQVAEGLADIHRLKIIHRDVKPSNIMIERDGNVRLLDLGVGAYEKNAFHSRANWDSPPDDASSSFDYLGGDDSSSDAETQTEPSSSRSRVVGTALYMSPEAYLTPDDVDARSDLYSLGAAFFYLLTGRSSVDWFDPIRQSAPTISFAEFAKRRKLPASKRCVAILEKLLQPNREKRYRCANEARRDLEEMIASHTIPMRRRLVRPAIYAAALALAASPHVYLAVVPSWRASRFLNQAQATAKTGDLDAALDLLGKVNLAALSSKLRADAFATLGEIHVCQAREEYGYLHLAVREYSRLLEEAPNDLRGLKELARCNVRLGRLPEAREGLAKAREAYPDDAELKTLDAQVQILTWESTVPRTDDETAEKKAALNKAIRLLSGEPGTEETAENLYWRSRVYLEFHDPEFAQIDLERSLELDPNYWQSVYLLGKIAFDRLKRVDPKGADWPDEFQTTVAALQNAAGCVPSGNEQELAACFDRLSACYFWNRNYEKAAARCDRVVEMRQATAAVLTRRLQANYLLAVESQASVEPARWRKLLVDAEQTLERTDFFGDERAETLALAAKICRELGDDKRCVDFVNEILNTRSSIREYRLGDVVLNPLEMKAEAESRLNAEKPSPGAETASTEETPKPETTPTPTEETSKPETTPTPTEGTPKPESESTSAEAGTTIVRPDAAAPTRDEAERIFQELMNRPKPNAPENLSEKPSSEEAPKPETPSVEEVPKPSASTESETTIVRPDAPPSARGEAEELFQSLIDASKPKPNAPAAPSDEKPNAPPKENESNSGPTVTIE